MHEDFDYLFLQQLKNPANLQFLILFCCIPMQWVFYHGYTVPYMCCPAVYQGVGFGENFQLEALHLRDSISRTGGNCSTEILHQLSLN